MSKTYDVYVLVNKEPFELTVEYEYGDGKTDDKKWIEEEVKAIKEDLMGKHYHLISSLVKEVALEAIARTDKIIKITTDGLISFAVDFVLDDQGDSVSRENIEVILAKNYYSKSSIFKSTRNPSIFAFFQERFFENNKFSEIEELRKEMHEIKTKDPSKAFEDAIPYLDEIYRIKHKIFSKTLKQYNFNYDK